MSEIWFKFNGFLSSFFYNMANGKKIVDENTCIKYVEKLGFKIVENKGMTESYILEEDKLHGEENKKYKISWDFQNTDPQPYFYKEIKVYSFLVENIFHENEDLKKEENISICVMYSVAGIIGGYISKEDGLREIYPLVPPTV